MLSLIQLVTHARVDIAGATAAAISKGITALVGIEKSDTEIEARKMVERILQYRIFPDNQGRMNLSLRDVQGDLLIVPQLTLVAETNKGTRPGFSAGMAPEAGKKLFEYLVTHARQQYARVEAGVFGAYMQVSLCNDGPVTFLLKAESRHAG
ncbi:D-aminoacyl-tRNA deacylase [Aquicella siphonis]|nr:D-aminoacyl-tRNA deacylase [Aquicella siphonis]